MNELRVTLQQAEKKNIDLNAENRWLQVMIDENVITFDEGINCYTSDMQTCDYSLLQCNVPSSSIAPVISAVFKLAKQKTTILPSRTILYTVHCILYTVYCTLYTVHCILYTVYCTLYTVHCILYTVYCTLYTVHCILFTVNCMNVQRFIIAHKEAEEQFAKQKNTCLALSDEPLNLEESIKVCMQQMKMVIYGYWVSGKWLPKQDKMCLVLC